MFEHGVHDDQQLAHAGEATLAGLPWPRIRINSTNFTLISRSMKSKVFKIVIFNWREKQRTTGQFENIDDGEIHDLSVGQNRKNNSPSKQSLDLAINKPITTKQGIDQVPNSPQDDELKIEGADDIFHLNPAQ